MIIKKKSEILKLKPNIWITVNPVTGLEKEAWVHASAKELEAGLCELQNSFLTWSLLTISQRQNFLIQFLENFIQRKDEIALLITEEMGKPLKESIAEVKKCILTIQSYLKFDYHFLENQNLSSIYKKSFIHHQPVGIVYSIMPWNFPFYQVIRMMIPSLLGGNVVLLKHSEITPKSGQFFNILFEGVWTKLLVKNLLLNHEMTDSIIGDYRVGGVSITGSTTAGLIISSAAGKYMKKSVLELGGSDASLICADANLEKAAKSVALGRLMNTGQSCICIKRCVVDVKILKKFLDLLKIEFQSYEFGDPVSLKTDLGPLAHPKFKKSFHDQTAHFKVATKAQLIFSKTHGQAESSAYVDSEIYLLKENSEWLYDQEFFGPLLIVIPFHSEAEAITIANSTQFGLGASVWSEDILRAQKISLSLIAGQIAINDIVKSDMTLPFGGFKKSGLGRELSPLGILEFTQSKVISYA